MFKTSLALALMAIAAHAQSAVTLYTSESAYLAAVGATTTYVDFAGSPALTVDGSSFTPAVTFGSCASGLASCGTQVLHNSDGITDLGGSAAPNGVAALGGVFASPVTAFAFHYVSGGIASIDFGGGAASLDTSAASGFIGVVSDIAFTSFIANNAVFPGNVGNDRYFIDDLRINAPLPEPEAALMALGGLLLLAGARARRSLRG